MTYLLQKVDQPSQLPELVVAYGDFRRVTRKEPKGGWQHFFTKAVDGAGYEGAAFPERNVVIPDVNDHEKIFFTGFELPWEQDLSAEDVRCRSIKISTIDQVVGLNWINLDDAADELGRAAAPPFEDPSLGKSKAPALWMLAEGPRTATLLFGAVVNEPASGDDPDVQVYQVDDKWVAGVPVAELDDQDHQRLVVPRRGGLDIGKLFEFYKNRADLHEKVNACLTSPRPTEGYLWKEKWSLILVEPR